MQARENFKSKLESLGYQRKIVEEVLRDWGIYAPDENHFIELMNKKKEYDFYERESRQPRDLSRYTSKLNGRLEVPPEIRDQALKDKSRNPKIGQRMYQVKYLNQLDMLLHRNKQSTNRSQSHFIKSIQTKKPMDVIVTTKKLLQKIQEEENEDEARRNQASQIMENLELEYQQRVPIDLLKTIKSIDMDLRSNQSVSNESDYEEEDQSHSPVSRKK